MFNSILDLAALTLTRIIFRLLSFLPYNNQIRLLELIFRAISSFSYRFRFVSHRNLELAFPDLNQDQRTEIIHQMCRSLAILIVDFIRLPSINADWVKSQVEFPFLERYHQLRASANGKGMLIASGHLGSFELQAYIMGLIGHPFAFVVRPFKLSRLNRWWNAHREASGNMVIERTGAFREILHQLRKGQDIAILFDQNITRNHAVFVDWFGRPAATSKALALAALRTEAVVLIASLQTLGQDRYRMNVTECDFRSIYADSNLDDDQKIVHITQRISNEFEKMIRNDPGSWFWMHRRWKTTPSEEIKENLYS